MDACLLPCAVHTLHHPVWFSSGSDNVLSLLVQSLLSETQRMTYIVLCDARKLNTTCEFSCTIVNFIFCFFFMIYLNPIVNFGVRSAGDLSACTLMCFQLQGWP